MPRNRNRNMDRSNEERVDRTMGASSADDMAGNEGIDEPSLDSTNRMNRDRKSGNQRQQGRESTDNNGRSFTGQGAQKEGAEQAEGTGYSDDVSTEDLEEGR